MSRALQRILITAGPTHESIDRVRYLANRSSGRMGCCLAQAARAAGHEVTLLLGPASVEVPAGIKVERFESTADLQKLLGKHFEGCDVLIMAAAVADYRPVAQQEGKLPRKGERLVLELEPTPDLVAGCAAKRKPGRHIIAFALEEPQRLHDRANEKLHRKGVDAIVANPLETMGSATVSASVYTADGRVLSPPVTAAALDKESFAAWLIGTLPDILPR